MYIYNIYPSYLCDVYGTSKNQIAGGHPTLKDGVCFGPPARLFWQLEIIKSSLLGSP
jgi:hypothetical protein